MLINDEKFACEACVRGHRVSSCQHSDRPLLHVNKKGRPVSQCHHCRGLRKARASHVKCECAEKTHSKEDCPHDKGEKTEDGTCCCGHGARCSCALKKEHLDTVPEDIAQGLNLHKDTHKRPISSMNNHENKTTIFTNGHHKPVHKINDAHNHCGAPYRVPHKTHPLAAQRELAQRSSDSLPLPKSQAMTHEPSPLHDPVTSVPQSLRQVKSEHNSPALTALTDYPNSQDQLIIPPLDPKAYAYSPFDPGSNPQMSTPDYQFPDQIPEHLFMSYEQAHQYEPPFPSVGLSDALPEIDWSSYNFQPSSNIYDLNNPTYMPGQPPSYASNDYLGHISQPGLTVSSGEISETEDIANAHRPAPLRNDSHDLSNDVSSAGDMGTPDAYRLSSASSYMGLPQKQMLANPNLQSSDIDVFLKQAELENQQMRLSQQLQNPYSQQAFTALPQQLPSSQDSTFASNKAMPAEHPYTLAEAQSYAHLGGQDNAQKLSLSTPLPSLTDDPMWSCPQTPGGTNLNFEGDDDDWPQ